MVFKQALRTACALLALMSPQLAAAQTPPTASAPAFVRLDGALTTSTGEPRTGAVTLVISLYAAADDTTALWFERQGVTLAEGGRYTVFAGATLVEGLPPSFFVSNQAQWIGVGVEGEPEQPRVRVLSVPYSLSAGNADTLGGAPAAAYVMTENLAERVRDAFNTSSASGGADNPFVSSAGSIAKFSDTSNTTVDSAMFESSGRIGIGTQSPISLFHLSSSGGGGNNLFTVENTNGDGYGPMFLAYKNSPSPANGDVLGYFVFWGKNSGAVRRDFGTLLVASDDVTPSSEDSSFRFWNFVGGTEREVMTMKAGNFGVGVTNPTALVHIAGNSATANPFIRITDTATGGHTYSVGSVSNPASFDVHDVTAGAYRFTITGTGNVGIGTTAPAAKLHVVGDVVVDGNIGAKYQDVAEWVETGSRLEAGTIVIIDETDVNRLLPSVKEYDTRVAGAVSAQPGLTLGEAGDSKSLVAQSGRVRVKVDATYGAIKAGDLIVTSPTPGHGMVSKPVSLGGIEFHKPGTLVGKALEGLASGKGEILVLLTLQ